MSDNSEQGGAPLTAEERRRLRLSSDPTAADELLARLPADLRPILLLAILADAHPEELHAAIAAMRARDPDAWEPPEVPRVPPELEALPPRADDASSVDDEWRVFRATALPVQTGDFFFEFEDPELAALYARARGEP